MKAADIPDVEFIRVVDAVQRIAADRPPAKRHGIERPWANWGPSSCFEDEFAYEYGPFVCDFFPHVPEKVLQAKGRRVIGRGLMTGCMCGCRGDMEVTEKGLELLREADDRVLVL